MGEEVNYLSLYNYKEMWFWMGRISGKMFMYHPYLYRISQRLSFTLLLLVDVVGGAWNRPQSKSGPKTSFDVIGHVLLDPHFLRVLRWITWFVKGVTYQNASPRPGNPTP